MIGMNAITAHSSQLTAHTSQLTAHSSCQALKQTFSHFCEKVFSVVSQLNELIVGGVK